ncbi:hypothetical protein DMN91_002242 [Ooceraea biroi]|uniref:RRM domain-containing protein n=2 Tax=Formicidae TaxID=36668 RepID=A0A3L8E1L2_OOCBI|nr:hypothetical protein DMN91_002242 [Ooceraea biroi]
MDERGGDIAPWSGVTGSRGMISRDGGWVSVMPSDGGAMCFMYHVRIMNNNSVEQPDPDNIKMFVGQVPHDMDENDLRTMFEEYGRVHQINILRDKITGSHRGK